ncbi:MAG: cell division protein FtsZ, partial [Steroidobacteraceae bacterium]|nr:cell division protein FtsZ [Steroidobacteraceae bacterium]
RAKVAAEMAVSSPLLEDVNLSGAQGILVNVTAGMDLAIGEFQEVGAIVKQFASDDATVVVGTVIDPEITDELRVTVVATGLGRPPAAVTPRTLTPAQKAVSGAGLHAAGLQAPAQSEPPMRVVRRGPLSPSDYSHFEKPAVQRKVAVGDGLRPEAAESEDILDIPAFLRRQAD